MKIKRSFKIILVCILFLMILSFSFIQLGGLNKLKANWTDESRKFISRYFLPYYYINYREKYIEELVGKLETQKKKIFEMDFHLNQQIQNVITSESESVLLSNEQAMNKYKFLDSFYTGIWLNDVGTAFIDLYKDQVFVISARGLLLHGSKNIDNGFAFQKIRNK